MYKSGCFLAKNNLNTGSGNVVQERVFFRKYPIYTGSSTDVQYKNGCFLRKITYKELHSSTVVQERVFWRKNILHTGSSTVVQGVLAEKYPKYR